MTRRRCEVDTCRVIILVISSDYFDLTTIYCIRVRLQSGLGTSTQTNRQTRSATGPRRLLSPVSRVGDMKLSNSQLHHCTLKDRARQSASRSPHPHHLISKWIPTPTKRIITTTRDGRRELMSHRHRLPVESYCPQMRLRKQNDFEAARNGVNMTSSCLKSNLNPPRIPSYLCWM